MSLKSSTVTDTSSEAYVKWMSAVWKANDLRNKLAEQLKECERLKPE